MPPVLVDVRNAFEARDNGRFYPALERVQQLLARQTPIRHLDPVALQQRRDEVVAELAAIDAEVQRRQQPIT